MKEPKAIIPLISAITTHASSTLSKFGFFWLFYLPKEVEMEVSHKPKFHNPSLKITHQKPADDAPTFCFTNRSDKIQ